MLILTSFFVIWSCQKDELSFNQITTKSSKNNTGFKTFAWSNEEKDFFSIIPRNGIAAASRTETDLVYHPLVIKAYNEIARQNEQGSFVDGIVKKVGLPVWSKAFVHYNEDNRKNIILIPFTKGQERKTSAIIALTYSHQDGDRYIINALDRAEITNVTSGNAKQKLEYARWMLRYDKLLFNVESSDMQNAYCEYIIKSQAPDPVAGSMPPTGCVWKLLEYCSSDDNDDQTSWWGAAPDWHPTKGDHDNDGIPNSEDQDWSNLILSGDHDNDGIPNKYDKGWFNLTLPIGDHDGDGIPNMRDPEWYIWYANNGDHDNDGIINKDDQDWHDFEIRHPNWEDATRDWGENWSDDHETEDIDEWYDNYYDPNGGDDISDWLDNILDDIRDWLDSFEHGHDDETPWDWWDRIDDPCYDFGPKISTNNGSTKINKAGQRDTRCEWFYVLDCPNNPNGWTQVVSCPTCTGNTDDQVVRQNRVEDFISKFQLNVGTTQNLIGLSDDCSSLAPPIVFEECLKEKYITYLANKLNISLADATSLWKTHQQLLKDNQSYQDEYSKAGSPEIGSESWDNFIFLQWYNFYENSLKPIEKVFIKAHPAIALHMLINYDLAKHNTIRFFGVNGSNDCSDAFRHCLFQALNTQSVGLTLAKEFGDAHEDGEDLNNVTVQMDFYNNWVGYQIGEANKFASLETIIDIIKAKMKNGELKIFDKKTGTLISSSNCF